MASSSINAEGIVALHRQPRAAPVNGFLSLAAAIEHMVWMSSDGREECIASGGQLLELLRFTGWPERGNPQGDWRCGARALPASENNAVLRRHEAELRQSIEAVGFSARTAKALGGALVEVITNVWEHAQTNIPLLLAYQIDATQASLGVADVGIGVLRSLQFNPAYARLTSSMAALKQAMALGVSRYPDRNRGFGFDTILRSVADNWGAVRLRTGEAVLDFRGTTEGRLSNASYGVPLLGLQVVFSCSKEPNRNPIVL